MPRAELCLEAKLPGHGLPAHKGPPLLGPSPVSQPVPWLDAGDVALESSAAATESVVTPATDSGDEPR